MTEYRKSLIEKLFAIDEGFGAFRFDFDGDSLKLKHPLEEAMAVIERDAELMEEKDQTIESLQKQLSESRPLIHAKWILSESPYAEHEEAVDGESHPCYICSNCHHEAGFECDPDGFAGYQDLTKWCGGCSAKMNLKEDV